MPQTRSLQGEVSFPANAGDGRAAKITIELRDVSAQDQPSTVVAFKTLENEAIGPGYRVPFELQAPTGQGGRSLALRVQVDMQPGSPHAPGDFLSTVNVPVPAEGEAGALVVPVTKL